MSHVKANWHTRIVDPQGTVRTPYIQADTIEEVQKKIIGAFGRDTVIEGITRLDDHTIIEIIS